MILASRVSTIVSLERNMLPSCLLELFSPHREIVRLLRNKVRGLPSHVIGCFLTFCLQTLLSSLITSRVVAGGLFFFSPTRNTSVGGSQTMAVLKLGLCHLTCLIQFHFKEMPNSSVQCIVPNASCFMFVNVSIYQGGVWLLLNKLIQY